MQLANVCFDCGKETTDLCVWKVPALGCCEEVEICVSCAEDRQAERDELLAALSPKSVSFGGTK